MTSPLPSLRTFLALDLMTVWPIETWPSPPTTTLPPLRTVKIVVPCQTGSLFWESCMKYLVVRPDLGRRRRRHNGAAPAPNSLTIDRCAARLVVHHSNFDVLIPSHSRIGKLSGGTMISMLL